MNRLNQTESAASLFTNSMFSVCEKKQPGEFWRLLENKSNAETIFASTSVLLQAKKRRSKTQELKIFYKSLITLIMVTTLHIVSLMSQFPKRKFEKQPNV